MIDLLPERVGSRDRSSSPIPFSEEGIPAVLGDFLEYGLGYRTWFNVWQEIGVLIDDVKDRTRILWSTTKRRPAFHGGLRHALRGAGCVLRCALLTFRYHPCRRP
jgi:hypothetical protein